MHDCKSFYLHLYFVPFWLGGTWWEYVKWSAGSNLAALKQGVKAHLKAHSHCQVMKVIGEAPWLDAEQVRTETGFGGWIMSLQNLYVEVLTPVPPTVTAFGDGAFKEGINIKWGHVDEPESNMNGILRRRGNQGTGRFRERTTGWRQPFTSQRN